MELPSTIRDKVLEELEEYIETIANNTPAETVVAYLLELLEVQADEEGLEDLLLDLEGSAALDSNLADALEEEMSSNEEFERTAEEVLQLLERMCEIEWVDED